MKYEENRTECDKRDKHEIKNHFSRPFLFIDCGAFLLLSHLQSVLLLPCCLVHLLSLVLWLFISCVCLWNAFYEKAEPWKQIILGFVKTFISIFIQLLTFGSLNQIKFHLNVLNLRIWSFFFGNNPTTSFGLCVKNLIFIK